MNDDNPGIDALHRFQRKIESDIKAETKRAIDAQFNLAPVPSLSPVGSGDSTRPVSGVSPGGVPDNSGAGPGGPAPETEPEARAIRFVLERSPFTQLLPPDSGWDSVPFEKVDPAWRSIWHRPEMLRRSAWRRIRDPQDSHILYGRHPQFDRAKRYGVTV